LIENWTELPPNLFLPLGAPSYLRSVLAGLSAAANEARHRQVTGLIGGIVGSPEFDSFLRETEVFGDLSAGAMIQNAVALHAAADLARRGVTLWIDLAETIRTAHGFPTEIQQADSALDDYAASGNLAADPFKRPDKFLMGLFASLLSAARSANENALGIDCAGGYAAELLGDLHRMGFRRFSAPPSHRDEIRLLLGQPQEE
jgi:pyruvate,orthophosphate dikinase